MRCDAQRVHDCSSSIALVDEITATLYRSSTQNAPSWSVANQSYFAKHSAAMPKVKENLVSRAKKLVGDCKYFDVKTAANNVTIFCKQCESAFKVDEVHLSSQFNSHLKSAKHQSQKKSLQPSISSAMAESNASQAKNDTYILKLTTAFLEAGIPLWKLNHRSIRQFFLKEHNEILPSTFTIYKQIDGIYAKTMQKIKDSIGVSPIYLIVDETTDACRRYALNVLVGKLDGAPSKPMLLTTIYLDKTNNTTVQQGVHKACATLYGAEIPFEKVWLLVTDQAPYMLKAGRGLKGIFPNLKHVTCLVHGLNRVCEVIKERNEGVNRLIASMKAVLLKSPVRRQLFSDHCGLRFPPDVIEIRWNSWLNAAFYYAENFSAIKTFVQALDEDGSQSVAKAKEIIDDDTLERALYSVHKYTFLTEAITQLEKRGMTVEEQIGITSAVKCKLSGTALDKFERVISRNPDINFFERMPVEQKIISRYAPLTSVDVERSFSIYKYILSDQRHSLTESNLAMLNVIQFNNFMED